jgi:hypothetical protein
VPASRDHGRRRETTVGLWIRTDDDAPHKLQAENVRLRTDLAHAHANTDNAIDAYNADRRQWATEREANTAEVESLTTVARAAAAYVTAFRALCETDIATTRGHLDQARELLERAVAAHAEWEAFQ